MGSAPSQPDDEFEYHRPAHRDPDHFQSSRSLRSAITRQSIKKPADTRSTVLRVAKTHKDQIAKDERDYNEQNGFTPFTPRGTIGYSTNPSQTSRHAPPTTTSMSSKRKVGSKKGEKGRGQNAKTKSGGVSFQSKHVYISDEEDFALEDEDDGLTGKDKIESYLRKSRVPETKVRELAVKIYEHACKEQNDHLQQMSADNTHIRTILQNTITQPLDLLLYGKANKTNVKKIEHSLEDLAMKVSDMIELLETDIALCFDSCGRRVVGKVGSKSVPLVVRDTYMALETDYDILHDKYHELRREKEVAQHEQSRTQHRTEALEETSIMVEKEYKKLADQNREMSEYIRELKIQRRQLKVSNQHLEEENAHVKKQVTWFQESNSIVSRDVLKLQETCTQLQVHNTEQAKEIRRLKDPDKELLHKIQRLETELVEAKTANRKLELEKGGVKTTLTKLQAQYDTVQKDRSALSKQKQRLVKENEKVKTTNKKLKLSS